MNSLIRCYLDFDGDKTGFLMTGNKCFYLFGNQCIPAKCTRVIMKSESTDINSDYHENLLAVERGNACDVYIGNRRILRLNEMLLTYELPLADDVIYGVMTGGKEFITNSAQFTDKRIAETINALTERKMRIILNGNELEEMKKAINKGEIKALGSMYLSAKSIEKELL